METESLKQLYTTVPELLPTFHKTDTNVTSEENNFERDQNDVDEYLKILWE